MMTLCVGKLSLHNKKTKNCLMHFFFLIFIFKLCFKKTKNLSFGVKLAKIAIISNINLFDIRDKV